MTPGLKAWIWLGALALVMGALIFGAAGDPWFWQGWTFLAVFFGASALITRDLIAHDPALLERRLKGGPTQETEPAQRLIMIFMSLGFVALIVVPGLDRRFGWSQAPPVVAVAGDVLIAAGFLSLIWSSKQMRSPRRRSASPRARPWSRVALTPSSAIRCTPAP